MVRFYDIYLSICLSIYISLSIIYIYIYIYIYISAPTSGRPPTMAGGPSQYSIV